MMRSLPQPNVKPNKSSKDLRKGANEAHQSPGPTERKVHSTRQERLSCPSIRRLQAKMEAENRQTRETMELLLNTENGFIKELERALKQHDIAEQRRRELLHKQWTEREWLPLQKQLHQRVSSCGAIDIKRRQNLYSHFLQHCNSKSYVFLDTYNRKEYDPLFRPLNKSHYQKLAEMKKSPKEAWTSNSTADSIDSSRKEGKLPHHFQSSLVSSCSVTSRTQQQGIPSSYASSTSTKTERKAVRTLSRFENTARHVDKKHRDIPRCDSRLSPRYYT